MDDVNLALLELELRSLLSTKVEKMESMGLQTRPNTGIGSRRLKLHYVYQGAQQLLAELNMNLALDHLVNQPTEAEKQGQTPSFLEQSGGTSPTIQGPHEAKLRTAADPAIKLVRKRKRGGEQDDGSASKEKKHKKRKEVAPEKSKALAKAMLPSLKQENEGLSLLEQCISFLWGIDFEQINTEIKSTAERILSPHCIFNVPLILHDIQANTPDDLDRALMLGEDWRARAALFCHEIKVFGEDRKGDFNVFYARMAKLHLYRCLVVEGHANSAHAPAVASKSPYPSHTIINFVKQGQKLNYICGGHIGLIFLLPLLRDDGSLGVPHIANITKPESKLLSNVVRKAVMVRTMCSLGLNVMRAARNGHKLISQELLSLSLRLMQTDCLDVQRIMALLEPWAARPCNCF